MVAHTKEGARQAFAKLLNAELDRVGIPGDRARIGTLHRQLKHKGKPLVSREQIRKWIRGVDIPDQANLRIVCEQLGLDWAKLQTGATPTPTDPLFPELKAAWEALQTDTARRELIRYARYLGATDGSIIVARPEGSDRTDSEGERASLHRHRRA